MLEEAQAAAEEVPSQVELPRGLYPDLDANLEAERREDETKLEDEADDVYARIQTLGSEGNPESIARNLKLAETYYFAHDPATPIIADYDYSLDVIMEAAQSFVVETPLGVEPRQRVEFFDVQHVPPFRESARPDEEPEPLYPSQCLRFDLSYLLTQTARLRETIGEAEPQDRDTVEVVRLPLMLGSKECYLSSAKVAREERPRYDECPHDPFGYFVVEGKKRSLIGQEKLSIDRSILIDRGAKRGTEAGFEVQMLCKTPSKALAHHVFYQRDVAKKTGQFEVMAYVQNLTHPQEAANALALLRAILIVQKAVIDLGEERDASSETLLRSVLSEHVAELTKGPTSAVLSRDFNAYLSTTLDKALDVKDDDEFLAQFAKLHSLPLFPRRVVAKAKPTPKSRAKRSGRVAGGRRRAEREAEEEEEREREEEARLAAEGTEPNLAAVWEHIMLNLFPQVTIDTYARLFMSRDPSLELEENNERLTELATLAMQRAKEHLLLHNTFRLFLYRESPATEKDDRDHFGIKRVELSGSLMANLYLKELQKARREILKLFEASVEKKGTTRLVDVVRLFFAVASKAPGTMGGPGATKGKAQNITTAFHMSFTRENWGSSGKRTTTKGVSHVLETESLASVISGIRKVSSKGDQAKRTILPHLFHASQGGLFCPFENPDDESCLDVDELVLLADGTHRRIGDMKEGDRIVTIDPQTGKADTTGIHGFFVRDVRPDEQVWNIIALNGRRVRATDDHPFFTDRGRVEARDLVIGDRLAIAPHVVTPSAEVRRVLVIDEASVFGLLQALGVHEKLASFHVRHLKKGGLVPLYSDDSRLPTIARVYGFALGDGTVGLTPEKRAYAGFSFGTEADALEFDRDLVLLGYKSARAVYYENEIVDKETGRVAVHRTWKVGRGSSFPSLLMALGVNPGKKTDVATAPIPEWVMQGSPLVKREFLAGFQGADGCKMKWTETNESEAGGVGLRSTSQQRRPELAHTLVAFMEQLGRLFADFGIESDGVKQEPYAEDRTRVELKLRETQENVLRYMERVSYRFATTKRHTSEYVAEYLRYLRFARDLDEQLLSEIRVLHDAGKMPEQIAEELQMTNEEVRAALTRLHNAADTRGTPRWCKRYAEWTSLVTRVGELLYMPLASRQTVQGVQEVADFTTHASTHSFVTSGGYTLGNCGIRKYLAISADVSRELSSEAVIEGLYPRLISGGHLVVAPSEWSEARSDFWPLYVNGIPLGYTDEVALDVARAWRRTATEDQRGLATISVYVRRRLMPGFVQKELHVESTPNRMIRPLHVCVPLDPSRSDSPLVLAIDLVSSQLNVDLWKASWDDLVWKHHVIEFLDKREEEVYSQTTAWFPWELANAKGIRYLHCEVNPLFLLGYNTESMPFAPHQQGTRTAYGANQLKHSVGVPSSMQAARFDTTSKVLHHPQRPITTTATYKAARFYDLPTGTNAMVAVLASRSNIEDAVVVNQAAVQRGAFNSTTFVTVRVMNAPGEFDRPNVPDKRVPGRPRQEANLGTRVVRVTAPKIVAGSYAHLAEAHPTAQERARAAELARETGTRVRLPPAHPPGIVPVGTAVQTGDVLVTKVSAEARGVKEFEQKLKHTRAGRVDAVQMVAGRTGLGVKIRIAFPNVPEVGDKFASIESQKGLLGELRAAVDMPFTQNGQIPDLLMNPHGFPSRQTFSYLMEAMYGKAVLTAPRPATLPGSSLRGAQPYNRTYQLSELEEAFIRPNLASLWFEQRNGPELRNLRGEYARLHPERYERQVVNSDTLADFPLSSLKAFAQKKVLDHAGLEVRHLLYAGERRLYASVTDVPPLELAKLRKLFSAELVDLVARETGREVDLIEDVAQDDLEALSDLVIELLYEPKEFARVGELPHTTQQVYNAEIRRDVLASRDAAYLKAELDDVAVDGVGLDALEESDLEGAAELVAEVRSTTIEGGEVMSATQARIEELFGEYMTTPEYVEERTSAGNLAKKVPLSYLVAQDPSLAARLTGRYGRSYVPLVDVVSLKDSSSVATERLVRLRKERAYTEKVKQGARNATAFNKSLEAEDVAEYLKSIGWDDGGDEVMVDGQTGEELRCKIFTGPVFYHVMTQMAAEKIQSRANSGAVSAMTRRPIGGRTKDGGGGGKQEEMNTFALIAHGASSVLHSRLNEESVLMRITQCRNCNNPCPRGSSDDTRCTFCQATGSLVRPVLPFPALKLKAFLATMGINMSFAGDVSIRDRSDYERRPLEIEQDVHEDFWEEREDREQGDAYVSEDVEEL